jgi:Tol biopolymer transport system component
MKLARPHLLTMTANRRRSARQLRGRKGLHALLQRGAGHVERGFQPGWSPDGTKIVFTRISANGTQENIYTLNADGSGLVQLTNTGWADQPDWGTHPLTR